MHNKKIILHLCADTGSDTYPYQIDDDYEVILVGAKIGVENYAPPCNVHGIIANPVCTEFARVKNNGRAGNAENGMILVNECMRIIKEAKPKWWALENPAHGTLEKFLGDPTMKYQPYQYGSPWTKHTALWGEFTIPPKLYNDWSDVPEELKNNNLYIRPNRRAPSLAFLHKSSARLIPEFQPFVSTITSDMELRSLCSQKFAQAFKKANP